jgi:hypothetical protein
MAALLGLVTIVIGFVVGVVLVANEHVFIGIILALFAIPLGLVVWMRVGDRY